MIDLENLSRKAEGAAAQAEAKADGFFAKVGKNIKWIVLGIVLFGLVIGYFVKGH